MKLKNTSKLFLFTSLFILSSCNNIKSTTSLLSSSASSSSSTSNSQENIKTKEDVIAELKKLSEGNYTLNYTYSNVKYSDIATTNYINLGNYGYVLLNDHTDTSKKLAYSFVLNDSEVKLQVGQIDVNNNPIRDLSSYDGLSLLKSSTEEDFSDITKLNNKKIFRTTSNNITQAFSKLMGKENDFFSSVIVGVDFSFNSEGDFSFSLLKYNFRNILVDVENGQGSFKNIGTSKDAKLEEFINNFSYPSNLLPTEANNILNSSLSTSSKLEMVEVSSNKVLSSRFSSVDYDGNNLQMTFKDDTSTNNIFVKKEEDKAYKLYLAANSNYPTVQKEEVDLWENLDFVSKYFSYNDFLNESGNTYTYYGYFAEKIISSLSQMSFNVNIDSFTLSVVNNKVKTINVVSDDLLTTDNKVVRYKLEIDILDKVNEIVEPSPVYDYDTSTFTQFDKLTSEETSYKTVASNDLYAEGNKKTTIVNPQLVYFEDVVVSSFGNSISQTGYYNSKEGWTKFKIEDNKAIAINRPSKTLTKKDMIGFDLYGYAFSYNKDKCLITPNKYVSNISKSIPFKLAIDSEINNDTIKMNVKDEMITSINYDVSSQGYYGKESIEFEYGTSTKPIESPDDLIVLLEKMDLNFKDPTNWKEENQSIYDSLMQLYNSEELVNSLPYFYDDALSGYWDGYFAQTSVMLYADDSSYSPSEFSKNYKALLIEKGYLLGQDEYGQDIYYKDNVGVLFNNEDATSIYITFKFYNK